MAAMVDVGVVISVEVHYETFNQAFAPKNVKFCGTAGRDFADWNGPYDWMGDWLVSNPRRVHREAV